jgi:outer membrane murein-binding lipoprotein Lpp
MVWKKRAFIDTGLIVFLLLPLAGCASKSDLDYLRYDVEQMGTRFSKVDKDLGALRNETKEGMEKNIKGLQTDMESIRKGAADLQANLEAMKVDMQVVSGKLAEPESRIDADPRGLDAVDLFLPGHGWHLLFLLRWRLGWFLFLRTLFLCHTLLTG